MLIQYHSGSWVQSIWLNTLYDALKDQTRVFYQGNLEDISVKRFVMIVALFYISCYIDQPKC